MASNGILPTETEGALVLWINSFSISDRVHSLGETNDGQVFWEMLREISSNAFTGELPSRKQSDYAREQNLHFVHRHISAYLDEQGVAHQPLSTDDIKEFASDGSSISTLQAGTASVPFATRRANSAEKLVKLILLVLINPPNAEMLNKIQSLPSQTQEVIAALIKEIDPGQSPANDEESQDFGDLNGNLATLRLKSNDPTAQIVARELELEAQQAELRSKLDRQSRQIQRLEVEKEDVNDAYLRLQDNYEALSKQSSEQEDQLKKLASAHSDRDQVLFRELETKISHQEEVISSRDFQITEHKSREEELQRRVRKLNNIADGFQKLEDELDIAKKDLLEQTKKANAGEKYRQKVQASQFVEKERDHLRQQLEDARPKLRAYDDIRRDNSRLVKENREIGSTLSQSEIGNSELRETKRGMIAEIDRLRHDLKAMREVFSSRQDNGVDVEDRSSVSEIHSSPTMFNGGLEFELSATAKQEEQLKYRISELEKENQDLARDINDKDSRVIMLQRQLDKAQQLLVDHSAIAVDEDIRAADDDCELATKPKLETASQLQNDSPALRQRCDRQQDEINKLTEERNQAWRESHHSLVTKAEIESETAANIQGYQALTDMLRTATAGEAVDMKASTKVTEGPMIEENAKRLAEQQQTVGKQEKLAIDLEARLAQKTVTANANLPAMQATAQETSKQQSIRSREDSAYTQNLERELKLMASAYHDLAGRLQMSNVVLQRRADTPKSWLERQRKTMEGVHGLSR